MKYKVCYNTIKWSYTGKRTYHEKLVEAENRCDAIRKVLIQTKGAGHNFHVEEINDGEG